MHRKTATIGLDLGGTNLRAVLMTDAGPTEHRIERRGGGRMEPEALLELAAATISDLRSRSAVDLKGVGVALAGAVFEGGGMREGMSNLPNLVGIDLASELAKQSGLPCRFCNDAQSAMQAEARFGAARGLRDAICITLGTGIGAGLLLDGRLRFGAHGRAGELGPWPSILEQPGSLSFEALAAPGSIEKRSGRQLGEMLSQEPPDAEAEDEIERFFALVGGAVANVHLLLDLEAAVICGGVTELGEMVRGRIAASFEAACPPGFGEGFALHLGAFNGWASAIGAGCLWLTEPSQ